jgi:hypothetical protein
VVTAVLIRLSTAVGPGIVRTPPLPQLPPGQLVMVSVEVVSVVITLVVPAYSSCQSSSPGPFIKQLTSIKVDVIGQTVVVVMTVAVTTEGEYPVVELLYVATAVLAKANAAKIFFNMVT